MARHKKEINMVIAGDAIRKLRESMGETQEQLAVALKVSRELVKSWERGTRTISTPDLIMLAGYYNVSTDYLLGLTENKTPNTKKRAMCEYTGLNEKAIDRIHWYATTHDDCEFNRKAINCFLNNENLYPLLKCLLRAVEAESLSKTTGQYYTFPDDPFKIANNEAGEVLLPASAAKTVFVHMAEQKFNSIAKSIINGCTDNKEELIGW